jgi:hypothetical protein
MPAEFAGTWAMPDQKSGESWQIAFAINLGALSVNAVAARWIVEFPLVLADIRGGAS